MPRRAVRFCLWIGLCAIAAVSRADKFAFLIGIESYEKPSIAKLGAACADSLEMRKILIERGFPEANIVMVTSKDSEPPTKARILRELAAMAARVRPGDFVLFSYSGHGVQYDQPYLLPYDVRTANESEIKRTAVAASELKAILEKIPAGALFLAFDMCREQPELGGRGFNSDNALRPAQARSLTLAPEPTKAGPSSVITVFACSPGQRSWEVAIGGQKQNRGILSYCLEEGLRFGAADEKGSISAAGLAEYVSWRVEEVARAADKSQQATFTISNPAAAKLEITSGVPRAQTTNPYELAFHQGFEAFRQHKFATALSHFEDAAKVKKSSSVLNMMGECEMFLDHRDKAERLFRESMEAEPSAASPRHNLAGLLTDQKKYAEAERLYREAIERSPGAIETYLDLAAVLSLQKKNREAEEACLEATKLDPTNPFIPFSLGKIRVGEAAAAANERDREAAMKEAERYLRSSISLDPEFWSSHSALGLVLTLKNDLAGAEKEFGEVCRLSPDGAMGYAQLARVQMALGKKNEAKANEAKARTRGYRGPAIVG